MLVPKGYLSIAQAAACLGITSSTLYRLIQDGTIPALMPRGKMRGMLIKEDALDNFVTNAYVSVTSRSSVLPRSL